MNTTIKLVGLGVTAAIALLLPTQARANAPVPTDDPAAPTGAAPQPAVVLEVAPAAGLPAAIDSHQQTPVPDPTAVEAVLPAADPSAQAQVEIPLLPSSTSSSDLQPIAAPVASEGGLPTPIAQPLDVAQTPSDESEANRWHFLAVPYIYVPFFISGSATFEGDGFKNNFVGNFTDPSRNFDFSPSQISAALRNSLNFAFFSGFEAWTPNYKGGIVANIDYVSLSTGSTVNRDVRIPGAAAFIPTEINASLNTQLWRGDLLGSYRFYDPARVNPEGIRSEYDLGPFVFDVLGGLSLLQINAQLGLSTNLGGSGQFNTTRTLISPLIGGRVRWNANPKLAVVGSGTISGFGLSGLMQYGIQGGVDWMFSGDTTLGAGYRFSFLDYNSDQIDLDVNQSGPYLNIGFRF
jgi:hypothetical protein